MPAEVHMSLAVQILDYKSSSFAPPPIFDLRPSRKIDVLNGTGIGQCDQTYMGRRSLASGASEIVDLNGTATKDTFGSNLAFLTLCMIYIINEDVEGGAANTTNLTIGGGTNPVVGAIGTSGADTKLIRPGGVHLDYNFGTSGIATVVVATGDELTITNAAGATNNYQIILVGRST